MNFFFNFYRALLNVEQLIILLVFVLYSNIKLLINFVKIIKTAIYNQKSIRISLCTIILRMNG